MHSSLDWSRRCESISKHVDIDRTGNILLMMKLQGALTAMITPFRDGKLDEARLREQIERQIKGGIDGLVPVGTTGESPTLDFAEHERVLELTVKFAAKRVPVI